jgi:hypothetical protein
MARDPRDVAVSRMLYRWQKGNKGQKDQYQTHLDLVLKKETYPRFVSFSEIHRGLTSLVYPGGYQPVKAGLQRLHGVDRI